ncbi:MAG TPA: diguanylate cyclase [Conexibacter sp.]|jgi:diguanylate cyclase (GGDEF)-like protein/putative nucleotidyltransferase with HDIG domain|nr:diguanylate cyclase [Conexibacter sp.]
MSAIPGMLDAPQGGTFEARMRVRVLASFYLAGATLVLLTLALPHAADASEIGLLAVALSAYVVGALLLWQARRVPSSSLPFALAWGSVLVTVVAWCSAEHPSPLVFFYLWVFLYSAYFFSTRVAIAQLLFVGVLYGALLLLRPPETGAGAWWSVGIATMAIAAIVIRVMRGHVELLIARLSDAARTDPLTQLPNRRGFRELLDLELERARRGSTSMTLLAGDLDHFKEVNDRSGHHVGDAVLQQVAAVLREGVRQIDVPARIGGEEFAVILPDTDAQAAFSVAERLRCHVRDAFADATVPITISFGIASHPAHAETAASLVRTADEALYGAKESGRNRSVIHSPALRELARSGRGGREERDVEAERFLAVVLDLAEAVDVRFSGSARHSETVGRYAELMAHELGLSERRVGRVRLAGLLHDVGKVGVPDAILRKAGPLSAEERTVIARHPELGAQILEHPSLADVQAWVAAHHERPDGSGYPHGLSDDELPLEARIVAVADAYEAMTSDRSYRDAIGHTRARGELTRHAGTQFDAGVVAAFLAVLDREAERAQELLDTPARH